MSGANGRSRGPFGPLEHLDEVQREIVDAALRVTAELTSLTGDVAGATSAAPQTPRPPVDVGSIRTTVSRSMDLFVDVMHGLLDSGLDAIEQYQAGQDVRIDAAPGEVVGLADVARLAQLDEVLVTPLSSRDGRMLTTEPVSGPDAMIEIPSDTADGTFHGVALSTGDDGRTVIVTIVIGTGR